MFTRVEPATDIGCSREAQAPTKRALTSFDERLDTLRPVLCLEQGDDIVDEAVLGCLLTLAVRALGSGKRGSHRQRRRPRCDPFRELHGPVELSAGFDNLLDEADPQSLGGIEFVAGQQPAHRIAPTRLAR